MLIALLLAGGLAWWLHKRGELLPNLQQLIIGGAFLFGAIRLLSTECARIGIQRPLIVTDAWMQSSGLLARVETLLSGAGIPNYPTEDDAVRAETGLTNTKFKTSRIPIPSKPSRAALPRS